MRRFIILLATLSLLSTGASALDNQSLPESFDLRASWDSYVDEVATFAWYEVGESGTLELRGSRDLSGTLSLTATDEASTSIVTRGATDAGDRMVSAFTGTISGRAHILFALRTPDRVQVGDRWTINRIYGQNSATYEAVEALWHDGPDGQPIAAVQISVEIESDRPDLGGAGILTVSEAAGLLAVEYRFTSGQRLDLELVSRAGENQNVPTTVEAHEAAQPIPGQVGTTALDLALGTTSSEQSHTGLALVLSYEEPVPMDASGQILIQPRINGESTQSITAPVTTGQTQYEVPLRLERNGRELDQSNYLDAGLGVEVTLDTDGDGAVDASEIGWSFVGISVRELTQRSFVGDPTVGGHAVAEASAGVSGSTRSIGERGPGLAGSNTDTSAVQARDEGPLWRFGGGLFLNAPGALAVASPSSFRRITSIPGIALDAPELANGYPIIADSDHAFREPFEGAYEVYAARHILPRVMVGAYVRSSAMAPEMEVHIEEATYDISYFAGGGDVSIQPFAGFALMRRPALELWVRGGPHVGAQTLYGYASSGNDAPAFPTGVAPSLFWGGIVETAAAFRPRSRVGFELSAVVGMTRVTDVPLAAFDTLIPFWTPFFGLAGRIVLQVGGGANSADSRASKSDSETAVDYSPVQERTEPETPEPEPVQHGAPEPADREPAQPTGADPIDDEVDYSAATVSVRFVRDPDSHSGYSTEFDFDVVPNLISISLSKDEESAPRTLERGAAVVDRPVPLIVHELARLVRTDQPTEELVFDVAIELWMEPPNTAGNGRLYLELNRITMGRLIDGSPYVIAPVDPLPE